MMRICGQEFSDALIERIRGTVAADPDISRCALSSQVCEWLNWRAPNGKLKAMSCRVALRKLEQKGILTLPPARNGPTVKPDSRTEPSVETKALNLSLRELGPVQLIPVSSRYSKHSRIWNGLMQQYHYLGAGPLCGAQIRYLIWSQDHGWLGALAFSAAAWRVTSRDQWIGWSDTARCEHLSKIVCNSRFLIVPHVKVPHLASHILSLCARRLRGDWQKRYGYAPLLLETFVEKDRFRGTSYRAANWQHVGTTRGRGRQDRNSKCKVPIKDVYVLPLHRNAQGLLCGKPSIDLITGTGQDVRESSPSDPANKWVEEEFGSAALGDRRLTDRLMTIAQDFYARPQASVPQACQDYAKTKAAYRFFENDKAVFDTILEPHYAATLQRAKSEKIVLAPQDTCFLNYSLHPATQGLGPIGSTSEKLIGLILHDTMAFNTMGTPLGLVDIQLWARSGFGKKKRRKREPIENKESYKWLKSFQRVTECQKRCPDTTFVSMGDREADIYELFALATQDPAGPKLLVRARQDRLLAEHQESLWNTVSSQDEAGIRVSRRYTALSLHKRCGS